MARNPFDELQRKNTALYQQMIEAVFNQANKEAAAIGVSLKGVVDTTKPFKFSDYPMTKTRLNMLLKKLNADVTSVVLAGTEASWTLANNKNSELARIVFGDNIGKLSKAQYERYFNNHAEALEAFKARQVDGLQLSDRVWKYTDQYQTEIEMALDLGIAKGQSAIDMTKDLKQYLQNPDALFRRVRNKWGALVPSAAMKAYHCGRGVYKSAFKNARRLAATENNIAYRTADYLRWDDLDFVVGIRVQPSKTNHKEQDICDELAGLYPKDFKFTGWHPLCRCYATSVLKTHDEFIRDLNDDTDRGSENAVLDVPQGFKDWLDKNSERIAKSEKLPYFLRDNGTRDKDGVYHLKPLGKSVKAPAMTPKEIAAKRHAARTPEDVEKIRDAWEERTQAIREVERNVERYAIILRQGESGLLPKPAIDALKELMKNNSPASSEMIASRLDVYSKAIDRHTMRPLAQKQQIAFNWQTRSASRAANLRTFSPEVQANNDEWERLLGIKRGKPMTIDEADRRSANPKFGQIGGGYSDNCQTCVPVYEMRRRGFDVTAIGNENDSVYAEYRRQKMNWTERFLNTDGSRIKYDFSDAWCLRKGVKKFTLDKKKLYVEEHTPDVGTYEIFLKWKGVKSSHVCCIEKSKKGVFRVDPQTGKKESIDNMLNKASMIAVIRIDDKIINPKIVNTILH